MFHRLSPFGLLLISLHHVLAVAQQVPLLQHAHDKRNVSAALFAELEELARIVDISYCVGVSGLGISKPFTCLSRCTDFPQFELVAAWNTGPLLSDSCGYLALDHENERLIVAFRGTYSIANTVMDLSTVPQEYVPYPGSGNDDDNEDKTTSRWHQSIENLYKLPAKLVQTSSEEPRCENCTVHMGFHISWLNTRKVILPHIEEQLSLYPSYRLQLVGHSLGGAVAALAGLDLLARGWDPQVTTFGEPRIGNANLVRFLDARFDLLTTPRSGYDDTHLRYRRVTHVDDPVPLLPLTEWGYAMHAGEIHITKPALSPDIADLQLCTGDFDADCIAGQDASVPDKGSSHVALARRKRDLLASVANEIYEVKREPWGIPSRYKLWELFFAHRDYFWRLGLCVPGGDPLGGGGKYTEFSEA